MTMRRFAILLALAGSGCATATIEDAVPVSAAQTGEAAPAAASGPGAYPNLNVTPETAADQFTDAQKNAEAERLRATRAQVTGQARQQSVPDRSAELRKLGASHADEAVRIIEGE